MLGARAAAVLDSTDSLSSFFTSIAAVWDSFSPSSVLSPGKGSSSTCVSKRARGQCGPMRSIYGSSGRAQAGAGCEQRLNTLERLPGCLVAVEAARGSQIMSVGRTQTRLSQTTLAAMGQVKTEGSLATPPRAVNVRARPGGQRDVRVLKYLGRS